jgi:putative spermidine/putrescine transport system substrate-binding protein
MMALAVVAVAAPALAAITAMPACADDALRLLSYGGAYQEAQRKAEFDPFEKSTGIKIVDSSWFGDIGKIRAMVEAKNVNVDVILGDVADAISGCNEGFLEPLPGGAFGDPADYLTGNVSDCAVATELVSIIYAYNGDKIPAAWGETRPQTIADLFDTKKFPGKRAFSVRVLGGLIEMVLLGDGVPPAKLYDVLGTKQGLDRVFAKLDAMKDDIIFYTSNAQPAQLLASGEVVMIQSSNGRIYAANADGKTHFVPVWDGQVYYPDVWFVPKGGNKDLAVKFLQFITEPKVMAALTNYIPYPPARRSALPLVSDTMKPHVGTSHELSHGIASNMVWWSEHSAEINERLQTWLAKK